MVVFFDVYVDVDDRVFDLVVIVFLEVFVVDVFVDSIRYMEIKKMFNKKENSFFWLKF